MNKQQSTALVNPCELAEQTSNQMYREVERRGPYCVSVVLTINVGEE